MFLTTRPSSFGKLQVFAFNPRPNALWGIALYKKKMVNDHVINILHLYIYWFHMNCNYLIMQACFHVRWWFKRNTRFLQHRYVQLICITSNFRRFHFVYKNWFLGVDLSVQSYVQLFASAVIVQIIMHIQKVLPCSKSIYFCFVDLSVQG